jgi:hypothetical protein
MSQEPIEDIIATLTIEDYDTHDEDSLKFPDGQIDIVGTYIEYDGKKYFASSEVDLRSLPEKLDKKDTKYFCVTEPWNREMEQNGIFEIKHCQVESDYYAQLTLQPVTCKKHRKKLVDLTWKNEQDMDYMCVFPL